MTKEKLQRLIDYWKSAAERSEKLASKVSGEGEVSEIYRDTVKALIELMEGRK